MSRVEKILNAARLTLSDTSKNRWSDDVLLSLLNEAQADFCRESQILHDRVDVPIIIGEAYFTLPENSWLLTRALYNKKLLKLVSHHELDSTISGWNTEHGVPKAIVYDRSGITECKIYPIPSTPIETFNYFFTGTISETQYKTEKYGVTSSSAVPNISLVGTYGVISSVGSVTNTTSVSPAYGFLSGLTFTGARDATDDGFGILTELKGYTNSSDFGIVVDVQDDNIVDTLKDTYGVVSNIVEGTSFIHCYYLKVPEDLEDLNSELTLPALYDVALKFYVCAHAFLIDNDSASYQKSSTQMALYSQHIKRAKKDSSRSFTRAGQFQTTYHGAI